MGRGTWLPLPSFLSHLIATSVARINAWHTFQTDWYNRSNWRSLSLWRTSDRGVIISDMCRSKMWKKTGVKGGSYLLPNFICALDYIIAVLVTQTKSKCCKSWKDRARVWVTFQDVQIQIRCWWTGTQERRQMQPQLYIFNLSQTFVLLHDLRFLASYLTITLLPFCIRPAEQIFTLLNLRIPRGSFKSKSAGNLIFVEWSEDSTLYTIRPVITSSFLGFDKTSNEILWDDVIDRRDSVLIN